MQVETQYSEIITKDASENVTSKNKIDECIDKIAKKKGFITYDVMKKKICADGGNYLGQIYEIDIKGKTRHGYEERAIFCKTMTPDPIDMGFMSVPQLYKRELFVYKQLMNVINELQDEAKIPVSERFNTVKGYDESYEEVLFLDNLSRKGFKTWYRMDVVSLDMAEVSIKQLARLHGMSFALREKKADFFNRHLKDLKWPFTPCKAWDDFADKFHKIALDNLDVELAGKFGDKIRKILSKYKEYNKDASTKYCLCHGDYRPNNILIKQQDGVVVDAVPVDYQLVSQNCPVIDFFYFMGMGTDYQFRKSYITHLKDLYYISLDKYLQYFDLTAESVLPKTVFERLYREKYDYILVTTVLFCPFIYVAEDEEIPDVTKECVTKIDFKFNDKFKLRLKDAVDEHIDLGYL